MCSSDLVRRAAQGDLRRLPDGALRVGEGSQYEVPGARLVEPCEAAHRAGPRGGEAGPQLAGGAIEGVVRHDDCGRISTSWPHRPAALASSLPVGASRNGLGRASLLRRSRGPTRRLDRRQSEGRQEHEDLDEQHHAPRTLGPSLGDTPRVPEWRAC